MIEIMIMINKYFIVLNIIVLDNMIIVSKTSITRRDHCICHDLCQID